MEEKTEERKQVKEKINKWNAKWKGRGRIRSISEEVEVTEVEYLGEMEMELVKSRVKETQAVEEEVDLKTSGRISGSGVRYNCKDGKYKKKMYERSSRGYP